MLTPDKSLNYGRHIVQRFIAQIPSPETCLDVGAGHGDDLSIVKKQHPSVQLSGIEVYRPYVNELKINGVSVHEINFENTALPVEDSSIDLMISNQVLEHTKEIFWVFHEMTRTLKVGGHLIIGLPNLASLHNRFLLSIGKQPTSIKNSSAHIRGFTKNDILELLNIFPDGFKLLDFAGSNFYPFSAPLAKPLASVLPNMAWSIFFLLRKEKEYNQDFFLKFPVDKQLETNFYLGK